MLTVLMVLLEAKRDEKEFEKKRSQLPTPSDISPSLVMIQFSSTTGQQWLKDPYRITSSCVGTVP